MVKTMSSINYSNQLMMGYDNLTESQIEKGVSILHEVIENYVEQ